MILDMDLSDILHQSLRLVDLSLQFLVDEIGQDLVVRPDHCLPFDQVLQLLQTMRAGMNNILPAGQMLAAEGSV